MLNDEVISFEEIEKFPKKKLKTTTITIDEEVWKFLNNHKKLGRDSHNSVLRRLLGLDMDEQQVTKQK